MSERPHDHGHDHGADHGHSHDHKHVDEHSHGHARGRSHAESHSHSSARDHAHEHAVDSGAGLGVVFWLIGGFTIVEAVGGWLSGSLAVLADAGHMFVDTLAIALAYAAHRLARRPADHARSFGHTRLQVLAAFVNSLLLLAIVVAIVVEAGQRLMTAHPINAPLALGVALVGV